MKKGMFRKTALATVIAASVPFYANQANSTTTVITSSGTEKFYTNFSKSAEEGDEYTIRIDANNGTFNTNGVKLYNWVSTGKAVIVYNKQTAYYSILHQNGVLVNALISGKGDVHGILLSDSDIGTTLAIDIDQTNINARVEVQNGSAYRIEEQMLGTLTIGSKGSMEGKTAISAANGGLLGADAKIVVHGTLKSNDTDGANAAVDFSNSEGALTMNVHEGTIIGHVLGDTSSSADNISSYGLSQFTGKIVNVEAVTVTEGSTFDINNPFQNTTIFYDDITHDSSNSAVTVHGTAFFAKPGTQHIQGTLNAGANSVLLISLGADPANNPGVQVTGATTLADGMTFYVNLEHGSFNPGDVINDAVALKSSTNKIYGTVSNGQFLASPILNLTDAQARDTSDPDSDPDVVTVDVEVKKTDDIVDSIEDSVGDSAESALTSMLNEMYKDGTLNKNLFDFFMKVSNKERLAKVSRESVVNNGGATQEVNITAMNGNTTQIMRRMQVNRTSKIRTGLAYGDGMSKDGFWVQALGGDVNQSARTNDAGDKMFGYDADFSGMTMGYEREQGDFTLGGAFTLANMEVDKYQSSDSSSIKNYQFSLYGSWEKDDWFMDAVVNVGRSNHKRNRYIDGFLTTPITADFSSQHYGFRVLGGTSYFFGDLEVQPMLGLNYAMVRTDSYREEDSSNTGLAMSVDDQKYQKAEVGAGVTLSQVFKIGKHELEPSVRLMAWHDFKGDQVETTFRLLQGGQDIVSKGADPVKNSYQGTASLSYRRSDNLTFVVGYERNQKTDYYSDNYFARMKYDF